MLHVQLPDSPFDVGPSDLTDVDVGRVREYPEAVLRLELVHQVDAVFAARERDQAVV